MLACPADHVVLLPNASQVSGVAEAAAIEARGQGIEVAVVPTKSPVQGLSAVAVHDPSRHFGDDVIAMAEAAAATRWSEVTIAQREALTMAGRCQPGDVLGLIDGEVVEIGSTVDSVAAAIIDRLLAVGGELITILVGRDAEPDAGEQLRRHIASVAQHVEVGVFDGGQPHYPLLIGVE
jgi:dihydroxyacetone kinase-like predicted kinase